MPTKPVTTAGHVDRKEKAGKAQGTTQARATKQTDRAVQPDAKPRAKQAKERETPPRPKAAKRASRPDGAATRQHLLDIAGQVFATRGFADATSKEICERAGTPMASVNYHFGSREALYEAALVEAHRQVVSLDELTALTEGAGDPRDKLRAVIQAYNYLRQAGLA